MEPTLFESSKSGKGLVAKRTLIVFACCIVALVFIVVLVFVFASRGQDVPSSTLSQSPTSEDVLGQPISVTDTTSLVELLGEEVGTSIYPTFVEYLTHKDSSLDVDSTVVYSGLVSEEELYIGALLAVPNSDGEEMPLYVAYDKAADKYYFVPITEGILEKINGEAKQ